MKTTPRRRLRRLRPDKRGIIAAAALLGALAVAFHAFWVEPRRLAIRETEVTIPDLPQSMAGLRLGLIADIHAGSPAIGQREVERLVLRANELHLDAVLLLGDYTYHGLFGRALAAGVLGRALSGFSAPAFAVFGNHDWWFTQEGVFPESLEAVALQPAMEASNIKVLENQAVPLRTGRGSLWIAGVAEISSRLPNVHKALARVPKGAPVVLMVHQPDIFHVVPASVSLVVAGHTHGGQVALPLIGPLYVPSRFGLRYAAGMFEEGGRRMFVTTGIGTSILPARLGVTPEIAVLTLKPRAASKEPSEPPGSLASGESPPSKKDSGNPEEDRRSP